MNLYIILISAIFFINFLIIINFIKYFNEIIENLCDFNRKSSNFSEPNEMKENPHFRSKFKCPEICHRGHFCQSTFQIKLTIFLYKMNIN